MVYFTSCKRNGKANVNETSPVQTKKFQIAKVGWKIGKKQKHLKKVHR